MTTTIPGVDGPACLPIASAIADDKPRARRRRSGPDFAPKCNPAPRSRLDDDRRALAERYMPLAGSMARRAAAGWARRAADDIRSAAYAGLCDAAQRFDEARGVDFATFARHRIRGTIADARRQAVVERNPAAGDYAEWAIESRVLGSTPDPDVGEELERDEAVESCIRRLSAAQARAIRLVYFEGRTQEEAAGLMGLSKASMCRLHRAAMERLAAMRGRLLAAG